MKRLLKTSGILLLALTVVWGSLAGCAGGGGATGTSAGSAVQNETTAAASASETQLDPVNLVWYTIGSPQPDGALVYTKFSDYVKSKLNATVQMNLVDWGNYDNTMKVVLNTGETCDVTYTTGWCNHYTPAVANGLFTPLNDLVPQYAPKLWENTEPVFWQAQTIKGKFYGVPIEQIHAMTKGVWLRKDLVDKYKFDVSTVKTLYDLTPFFETVKKNEPGIIPLGLDKHAHNGGQLGQCLKFTEGATGYDHVTKNGDTFDIKFFAEEPSVKELYDLLREWYVKGYIQKDAYAVGDITTDIKAQKYASSVIGNVKPGNAAEFKISYGYEVIDVPIGETVAIKDPPGMNAVPVSSKNPERAVMLLELLYTDKYLYNLISFGIEGTHYKKVSENRIEPIEGSRYIGLNWTFGCCYNSYLIPGQTDDVWEQTKKLNKSAVKQNLMGFIFDSTNVTTQDSACMSVWDEFLPQLSTGAADVDDVFPKYIAKLKAAGAEDIIAEGKRQLDAWAASK